MRAYPPVYTLGAAALMVGLDRFAPLAQLWPRNAWGWGPFVLGIALVLWTAALMRRRGTTLDPHGQASALVTAGPFAVSRNPIYLGSGVALAGLALGLGALAPWLVLPLWGAVIQRRFILPEEESLRRAFGPAFESYAARVRRWL